MADGRALITGASGGIGRRLATEFAGHGHDLVLVARREHHLEAAATVLAEDHGVDVATVSVDLARTDAAADLSATLRDRDLEPAILVNNAGVGTHGPYHESDRDRERDQRLLNVETPVRLTREWLPRFVERDAGGVLNLGSLAGFTPGPYMAGYYASKAYVVSFTESIAEELRGTDVTATVLCPGPVDTEFQDRAGMGDQPLASRFAHDVEDVAQAGYRGFASGDVVVVPGIPMTLLYLATRIAPRGLTRRLARRLNAGR